MSTWPQRESPESTQAQLGTDRYVCPLDGTALTDADDHWWCSHDSQPDGAHETLLAWDSHNDRMSRYQGSCIVAVITE